MPCAIVSDTRVPSEPFYIKPKIKFLDGEFRKSVNSVVIEL